MADLSKEEVAHVDQEKGPRRRGDDDHGGRRRRRRPAARQGGYGTDEAYELEYAPYGVDSGLCVGTATTAGNGTPVALEPCGVSSKTVWVEDTGDSYDGTIPLINGSDTNFSHPYVLHYPGNGYPTDMPRPQLTTYTLQQYSSGDTYENQLWIETGGIDAPYGP